MATNRSFANMLNPYSALQQKKQLSDRERIRNKLIDSLGRKPTEDEIDAVLAKEKDEQNAV